MAAGSAERPARLLIVTAVDAERDAIRRGLPPAANGRVEVASMGVGPASAAAGAAWSLARAVLSGTAPGAVICAGIAGGFTGRVPVGGTVLATRSVAADLGAQSPDGFLTLDELGFGTTIAPAHAGTLAYLAGALPGAVVGDVLTVSTVTGTGDAAAALADRYPDAVAEAMEGFGVAAAARRAGVAFAEIRTISNLIGPRDRAGWRIGAALDALSDAAAVLGRLAG